MSNFHNLSIKIIKTRTVTILSSFVTKLCEEGKKKCQNINIYNFKQIFIEISIF